MSETGDRGRSDFFAEAEELVDGLFRSLDQLEKARRSEDASVEVASLLNELFRGVHTLKGLAGIFGASKLGALAHELEGLLDDARLGRATIDETLLGQLQLALSIVPRLLRAEKEGTPVSSSELDAVLGELRGSPTSAQGTDALATLDLSPDVFAVLTEYEEHRLRVNIEAGLALFRLTVSFSLLTIDESASSRSAWSRSARSSTSSRASSGRSRARTTSR
jgi:two-component system, chemotaxis family, sensor kinase CheA